MNINNSKDWTTDPQFCPYCGGTAIVFTNTWRAVSEEPHDCGNTAELDEYQCQGMCEGRSFWG